MDEHPDLSHSLLPQKPKGRPKKDDTEPSARELAAEEISHFGPVLVRAKSIHDTYEVCLKGDTTFSFNRAGWLQGDDNFVTLYRKTAEGWRVLDVCIDDISTVTITHPI